MGEKTKLVRDEILMHRLRLDIPRNFPQFEACPKGVIEVVGGSGGEEIR